jgi:hypothetical protein
MVSRCQWHGASGAKKPGMHDVQVQRISKLVRLDPTVQAADPEVTYSMFKKQAALAIRRSVCLA